MTTIRIQLQYEDPDWETMRIIAHTVGDDDECPGWAEAEASVVFDNIVDANALLDYEFYDGYGGPQMPIFIAEDKDKLYFPGQYDGSTFIISVLKDICKYKDVKNAIPYPGG